MSFYKILKDLPIGHDEASDQIGAIIGMDDSEAEGLVAEGFIEKVEGPQTVGPRLSVQGPFKADVKWKKEVTQEQKNVVANLVLEILDKMSSSEQINTIISDVYNGIESITISPSGN